MSTTCACCPALTQNMPFTPTASSKGILFPSAFKTTCSGSSKLRSGSGSDEVGDTPKPSDGNLQLHRSSAQEVHINDDISRAEATLSARRCCHQRREARGAKRSTYS